MSLPIWLFAISLAGWATAFTLTGVARGLGELVGAVDRPRAGEVQLRSVPRSGGYAVLAGLWLALVVIVALQPAGVPSNPADDLKLLSILDSPQEAAGLIKDAAVNQFHLTYGIPKPKRRWWLGER